jgi:hypothetical protein
MQTTFAARGQVHRHRAWGLLGISLATAMVFVGLAVANQVLATRLAAGLGDRARAFHIASTSMITLFAVLVCAAIATVARPEIHKRLMLLATISVPRDCATVLRGDGGDGPWSTPGPRSAADGGIRVGPCPHRRFVDPRGRAPRLPHTRPAPSRLPDWRRSDARGPDSARAPEHDTRVVRDRGPSRAVQWLSSSAGADSRRRGGLMWGRLTRTVCSVPGRRLANRSDMEGRALSQT